MQIDNFIDTSIPRLRPTDHAEEALSRLEDVPMTQLPVIDEANQYQGILSEEVLYHATLLDNPKIADMELLYPDNYALTRQHLFESLRLTKEGMDFIPVTDEFQTLMGVVPLSEIAKSLIKSYTIQQKGAVVVLIVAERDYSLAQLSRLAETHYLKIIGVLVDKNEKNHKLTITLKLNKIEVLHFIATLERFEYEIVGTYSEEEVNIYDKKRLDLLLKYLEI